MAGGVESLPNILYEFGPFRVDPDRRLLLRGEEPVPITPKAFETLLILLKRNRELVSKEELISHVWPDAFVEDGSLAQNISALRKALGDTPEEHRYVVTLPGKGYRFTAPVRTLIPGEEDLDQSQPRPEIEIRQNAFTSSPAAIVVPESSISIRKNYGLVLTAIALLALVTFFIFRGRSKGIPDAAIADLTTSPTLIPLFDVSGEERMPALSSDGSRIAFLRHASEPNKSGIYVEVVGSQSLLQLSNDASDSHPAWSPDGRYISFLRGSNDKFSIELIPSLGGQPRSIYTGNQVPLEGPVSVSFSADSRELAFADWDAASQQSSIKLISLVDGSVHALTSPPPSYHDVAPAFSPDGNQIAFVRSTGPMFVDDIFVVPVRGGEPRQITFDHRRIFSTPAWTKDGQELLVSSTRGGMKSLWRIPTSGGSPRPVSGSGPQTDNPTVSLLRGEIAYEYTVEEENLWRVNLDVRGPHSIERAVGLLSSKTSNLMPQFSPDGSKIAFESDRSGYEEIWTCDPDGSNPTQVTKLERYSGSPRWSPDGRYIAFDFRSVQHSEIYVVEVVSGAAHSVASFPDADNVVPSWSHDGRWIYFASNRGGKDFHVWKVPSTGGAAVRLTHGAGFSAFESLDGKFVIYMRLSEPGLWKVPRDGGPETALWKGPGPNNWGNWTIGNDGIYFMDSTRDGPEIELLKSGTAKVVTVAKLERPSFCGLTVSPDNKAIVYSQRDRNQHDIRLMMGFH
jgi:Tol biopolymer transport system component/DNA-binding winged helix-turn-helix (wHTH) protein